MIIFDVGANNGSSCTKYINSKNIIYAFEPTPCCKIIEVDKLTEGAACTALLAKEFINNNEN